ncbi:MAG: STAS domain-containing protein [Halanaerobiales bacterium]
MFKLPESLDIYKIEDVRENLIEFIEKKLKKGEKEIVFDAAKTEDMDASGLQLLMAAYRTIREEKAELKIINRGQNFNKLLLLAGAEQLWRGDGNE